MDYFDQAGEPENYRRLTQVDDQNWLAFYQLACLFSRRGEGEKALAHLSRAASLPGFDHALAGEDTDLAPLRADPRFASIVHPRAS